MSHAQLKQTVLHGKDSIKFTQWSIHTHAQIRVDGPSVCDNYTLSLITPAGPIGCNLTESHHAPPSPNPTHTLIRNYRTKTQTNLFSFFSEAARVFYAIWHNSYCSNGTQDPRRLVLFFFAALNGGFGARENCREIKRQQSDKTD